MVVLEKQTLFDVAVQNCGSIEACFALAVKNNISITDDLLPGQQLSMTPVVNKDIYGYYSNNAIVPATGLDSNINIVYERIFDNSFDNTFN